MAARTTSRKYSIILGNLGNTCDRFLSSGYKDQLPTEELFRTAASIPDVEGIELLYWLRKLNYSGWYSMDQYPYREDGKKALAESIETVKAIENVIERFGEEEISGLISLGDATVITSAVREILFS
jgi:hypothetical protein